LLDSLLQESQWEGREDLGESRENELSSETCSALSHGWGEKTTS